MTDDVAPQSILSVSGHPDSLTIRAQRYVSPSAGPRKPRNPYSQPGSFSGREWAEEAACLGMDSSVFFAERGDGPAIRFAKSICMECEVREACLEWALQRREMHGIWGGKTPEQRRTEIRRRQKQRKRATLPG